MKNRKFSYLNKEIIKKCLTETDCNIIYELYVEGTSESKVQELYNVSELYIEELKNFIFE